MKLRLIVCLCAITGCNPATSSQTADPTPIVPIASVKFFNVEIPSVNGKTATLQILRSGQDGYAKEPTRVTVGDETVIVDLKKNISIPFAGQTPGLTRIKIGGQTLLIHAKPGDVYRLADDPCAGWALQHERFDTTFAPAPIGACVDENTNCPDGMTPISGPRLALDPQCPDPDAQTGKRCLVLSTLTWHGDINPKWTSDQKQLQRTMKIEPRSRCFETINVGSDQFTLAIGMGEHWDLREENGRVVGTASPLKLAP